MLRKLSTSDTEEILRKRASGQSPKEIGDDLSIPEYLITNILNQVQQQLIPDKKPSLKMHRLTESDRRKGGQSSQLSRRRQRNHYANRISNLIDIRIKSIELASVYYWLRPGSSKEFLITLPNVETGHLFHKALESLGIPNDAITLNWRCQASAKEQEEIQLQWGELAALIRFTDNGASKSMRLYVSPFEASDLNGNFKVSSRGLAQAFQQAGQQVVINAASW